MTADREFDNSKFINYLTSEGIDFSIRLRKITRVKQDGHPKRPDKIQEILTNFKTTIYGATAKLDHQPLPDSQLLSVLSQV